MARSAALPALKAESGLSHYLDEIRRFPMLEPQEEYMLARSWREHGDREAAHRLVTSHLRLVAKIAMGYRGYGLPIAEVVWTMHRNGVAAVQDQETNIDGIRLFLEWPDVKTLAADLPTDHERRMYSWIAALIHHMA